MRAPPARSLRSRQGYIWLHAFFTASQPFLQGCPGPTWGVTEREHYQHQCREWGCPHAAGPGGVAMLRLQSSPCLTVGSLLMGQGTKPMGETHHWRKAHHTVWDLLEERAGEGADGSQRGHPTPNPQAPFPAAGYSPAGGLVPAGSTAGSPGGPVLSIFSSQKMLARHQERLRESDGSPPWGNIHWAGSLQGCFLFLESSEFLGTEAGSNGAGPQSCSCPE